MFTKDNYEKSSKWHNYYQGCENFYIDILFNTNIDMSLFFKLIKLDGFYYNYLFNDNYVSVFLNITKKQIDNKIEETLLKNKILKKEK